MSSCGRAKRTQSIQVYCIGSAGQRAEQAGRLSARWTLDEAGSFGQPHVDGGRSYCFTMLVAVVVVHYNATK